MKQVITYTILIGVGVLLGFLIFKNSETDTITEVKTVYKERVKIKTVRDTVLIKRKFLDTTFFADTLTVQDTIFVEPIDENDTLFNSDQDLEVFDEDIITERLVSKRNVELTVLREDSIDTSELLNIKTKSFNSSMIVEFWESPLELTGYELSRNKLKLFGFNPNESISLQLINHSEQIILKTETVEVTLSKTQKFKSLNL